MIRVDVGKCTGCKKCETACAFYRTGRTNNRLSRIKVLNLYETGIDGPLVCAQCKERYCDKCPENALSIGEYGEIFISPTMCNLCGVCEKNCPIGAIEIFKEFVYVCDMCGGKPKCVEACTEGAIVCDLDAVEEISLEPEKKEAKRMNPGMKRYNYLKNLGDVVRKKRGKKYA